MNTDFTPSGAGRVSGPSFSDAALAELVRKYPLDAAYSIATAYAYRGEVDAAFAWLDRAIENRDSGLTYALAEPYVPPLRSDPRWEAFLRRLPE